MRIGSRHRAFALIAGVWLVLCGVLGARHEAREAHVVDARGVAVHASHLVGAHHGTQSDVHAVDDAAPDHDGCAIVTALHQARSADVAAPTVAAAPPLEAPAIAAAQASLAPAAHAVYRLAPKTSPPA